ncbi:MAG: hypothetical protein PHV00_06090 [Syntrophales bacterium]|nr:hypothetical protein [Syntrophales bacterium]
MKQHLIVSLILCGIALVLAIVIVEGCALRDEREMPSEAEIRRVEVLMTYHGTDEAYRSDDGAWYFDRGGVRCRLEGRGA